MIIDITKELLCILFFVFSLIGYVLNKRFQMKIRYWLIPAFVFYFLVLIKVTIFPIFIFDQTTLKKISEGIGEYFVFYQIKPFASILNYINGDAIIQLIGNLLLLSPLVVFVEIITKGRLKKQKIIFAMFFVSLGIELIQLLINYTTGHPSRVADIDDLIVNTLGAILTIFALRILEKIVKKSKKISTFISKLLYK